MRVIKFRGLRLDNMQWEYGFLLQPNIISNVVEGQLAYRDIIVAAETVGQFTGVYDRNGKEIYEGDIVKKGKYHFKIEYGHYNCGCCYLVYGFIGINKEYGEMDYSFETCEVIGNIYENRDLLEVV